jgi:hypothetical protein
MLNFFIFPSICKGITFARASISAVPAGVSWRQLASAWLLGKVDVSTKTEIVERDLAPSATDMSDTHPCQITTFFVPCGGVKNGKCRGKDFRGKK